MEVDKQTVCLSVDQKKLKDEYKDPDWWQKINKSDMMGTMEYIKEYLRSCHGVIRAPLAYVMRKSIIVQTYGKYTTDATFDNEMIARMLHLPPDKIGSSYGRVQNWQQNGL